MVRLQVLRARSERVLPVWILQRLSTGAVFGRFQVRFLLRRVVQVYLAFAIFARPRHLVNLHLHLELEVVLRPIRIETDDILKAFHMLQFFFHESHLGLVLLLLRYLLLHILDLDRVLLQEVVLMAHRDSLAKQGSELATQAHLARVLLFEHLGLMAQYMTDIVEALVVVLLVAAA